MSFNLEAGAPSYNPEDLPNWDTPSYVDDDASYKSPAGGIPEGLSASGPQPAIHSPPAPNTIRPPVPALPTRRPYPQRLPPPTTGAPAYSPPPRPAPTAAPLPPPTTTAPAYVPRETTTIPPTTARPYTYPSYPAYPPYHNYNPQEEKPQSFYDAEDHGAGQQQHHHEEENSEEQHQSFGGYPEAPPAAEPTNYPAEASDFSIKEPNFSYPSEDIPEFPEQKPNFPAYPNSDAGDISDNFPIKEPPQFPSNPEPEAPNTYNSPQQDGGYGAEEQSEPTFSPESENPYGRENVAPPPKQRKEQRQRVKPASNDDPFFSRINNDDPYGPFQFKDIFGDIPWGPSDDGQPSGFAGNFGGAAAKIGRAKSGSNRPESRQSSRFGAAAATRKSQQRAESRKDEIQAASTETKHQVKPLSSTAPVCA